MMCHYFTYSVTYIYCIFKNAFMLYEKRTELTIRSAQAHATLFSKLRITSLRQCSEHLDLKSGDNSIGHG